MKSEIEIEALTSRVMQAGANQKEIDDVYEELVEVMKRVWLKYQERKVRGDDHGSQGKWQN